MKLAEKVLKMSEMKDKDEQSMNSMGQLDKKAMGIVEKLMKESYGAKNESQVEMAEMMKELGEMDSKEADKFMEYMDEMASKYEMEEKKKK